MNFLGPQKGDALLVVDVQKDFLPGGSLAVAEGDQVIAPLNQVIRIFERLKLPVFATRNWHTPDHCSFRDRGGAWPPHCIARSPGADFGDGLRLPAEVRIISKAMQPDKDAYSGFDGTELNRELQALGVSRVFIGGLTSEYCVLNTVRDATRLGYQVVVFENAIRAVNVQPDDGKRAHEEMRQLGAVFVSTRILEEPDGREQKIA